MFPLYITFKISVLFSDKDDNKEKGFLIGSLITRIFQSLIFIILKEFVKLLSLVSSKVFIILLWNITSCTDGKKVSICWKTKFNALTCYLSDNMLRKLLAVSTLRILVYLSLYDAQCGHVAVIKETGLQASNLDSGFLLPVFINTIFHTKLQTKGATRKCSYDTGAE
ncbi:hypothetical protein ACJX0J_026567 [Zea mays]